MNMINSPQDYGLFRTRVLPILEAAAPTRPPFVLGALPILTSWASGEEFPQPEVLYMVKRLSKSVIAGLDIRDLRSHAALLIADPQLPDTSRSTRTRDLTSKERSLTVNPATLANFTNRCLNRHRPYHRIPPPLAPLPPPSSPSPNRHPSPHYKLLTLTLLTAHLTHHVGPEPPHGPSSLALPSTTGCCCFSCGLVNKFLASHLKGEVRFTLAADDREHLRRVLRVSHAEEVVTRETNCGELHDPVFSFCREEKDALLVTKVAARVRWERDAWEERVEDARKWLEEFAEDGVLGKIIGRDVGGVLGTFLRESGVELSGVDVGGSRGVKRKAEGEVEMIAVD